MPRFGLLLALPAVAAGAAPAKCYAMALSGGGDKGAFEAGAIQGLVARLPAEESQWSVVTGISAGSIVSSGMALFDVGDEVAMADFVVSTVTSFTKDDVYKSWFPLGFATGLNKDGLYDTSVFLDSLKSVLGSRSRGNRKITIGATEDTTGSLMLFNESDWTDADAWAQRVRASAAIPGIFQSVEIDDHVYSDGGCVMGVNIFSAVNRCREMGVPDEDIVVDIISCDSEKNLKAWDQSSDDESLQLLLRGMELKRHNAAMADIWDACAAYPDVSWRYYIEPSKALPSNGLEFNTQQMKEMVQIGNADAGTATVGAACAAANAHRHSNQFSAGSVLV